MIRSAFLLPDAGFPAAYTGLLLGASSLGGTFIVAGTGAFFFAGFDALVLLIGTLTGFVIFMAIALAPFYRKFGAFTVPSYLGRRFESRTLRVVTAAVTAVPMLLVLAAELRIGGGVAQRLVGGSSGELILLLALTDCRVDGCRRPKRSFTWVGVAQSIALFLALLAVATTVSVIVTSLPIPQLAARTDGSRSRAQRSERGLQLVNVWPLAFQLPQEGFATLTKPYTQPFGAIGPLLSSLARSLSRRGSAPLHGCCREWPHRPVFYEARKSLGWATVFSGLAH